MLNRYRESGLVGGWWNLLRDIPGDGAVEVDFRLRDEHVVTGIVVVIATTFARSVRILTLQTLRIQNLVHL